MSEISPARLAANRQNAQKSTGPRTATGKKRSSKNARKPNLGTQDLILRRKDSPEDAADFEAMLGELMEQYDPQSLVERSLVESVAACLWRRRRALRFETAAMGRQLDSARTSDQATQERAQVVSKEFESVMGSIRAAEKAIDALRKPPAPDDAVGQAEYTALVEGLARRFDISGSGQALIDRLVCYLGNELIVHTGRLGVVKSELGKVADRMEEGAKRAADVWLPPFEELGKLVRYENMLNRQLHRALTELRRIRAEQAGRGGPSSAISKVGP